MRTALVFATAFSLTAPGQASPIAEVVCAPTGEMQERLTTQMGAERAAVGPRDSEQVTELRTVRDGAHWTMVVAYASGTSCIVAVGQHWQDLSADGPA